MVYEETGPVELDCAEVPTAVAGVGGGGGRREKRDDEGAMKDRY